jgi:hypothetical protein
MGNKAKSLTEFSINANRSLAKDRNVLKGGTAIIRRMVNFSLTDNINYAAKEVGKIENPQEGQGH